MNYYSCPLINDFYMNFNGRIDTGEKVITLCCEKINAIPGVSFAGTPEDTLRSFVGERLLVVAENIKKAEGSNQRNIFSTGCKDCVQFKKSEWTLSGLINYVNLSMYPAPCQCHCMYCTVEKNNDMRSEKIQAAYEMLFDTLKLAKDSGIIAADAVWQVSSGEITIHPYRKQIIELVQGQHAQFYTNCFKYDEDIAQNLRDNANSAINLSIDAGTPDTWKKIKGSDNFEEVTSNLAKYYMAGNKPGQITLKYIVLPGINDIYEDYLALIEIMKVLKVTHLTISRDTNRKYHMSGEERTKLIGAAAYLVAMCCKNNITNDMFAYSSEEQEETVAVAREILRKGQV